MSGSKLSAVDAALRALPPTVRHLGDAILDASPAEFPAACRALYDYPVGSEERNRLCNLVTAVKAERAEARRVAQNGGRKTGEPLVITPRGEALFQPLSESWY